MRTFGQYVNEELAQSEEDTEVNYPSGVYIAVSPDEITTDAIQKYQEKYLKQYKVNNELHCTLIYSQKPHVDIIEPASYSAIATFESFELFGPKQDTLVIKLNSKELERRNKLLSEENGFISDYDEYQPHITLAYGIENIDLNSLPAIEFSMTLQDEYVEPLDTDWANDSDDEDESGTLTGKALKKMKDDEEKLKTQNKKDSEDDDKNNKEKDK